MDFPPKNFSLVCKGKDRCSVEYVTLHTFNKAEQVGSEAHVHVRGKGKKDALGANRQRFQLRLDLSLGRKASKRDEAV